MQLTTHTDYALRLLIYLSSCDRRATTREVAAAYGISVHHLTKVAKALTRGGWLLSARGGGGGLTLAPHTPETRVGEIVRYTEGSLDLAECFNSARNGCPITSACHLKSVLYRARKAFFDVLDAVTVRDICRNPDDLNALFKTSGKRPRRPGERPKKQPRLKPH